MILTTLKNQFLQELIQYDVTERNSLFFITIEECLAINKADYFLYRERELSIEQINKVAKALSELKKNIPIQYIFHRTYFYGMSFFVNDNVLIPRQETEELVEWILRETPKNTPLQILDIGTGSGVIAIALKKYLPEATVFALDISEKALEVAQRNAKENKVSVHFLQEDILKVTHLGRIFDIIGSNPPYVRNSEKREIALNVLEHEPHLALFVPDDNPLLFYEKIAELAHQHLSKQGKLFFEMNQYLAKEMIQMLNRKGFRKVVLQKDLSNHDRMILATIE